MLPIPIFSDIWSKIMAGTAAIGAIFSAIFYFMWKIKSSKVEKLKVENSKIEADRDRVVGINVENAKSVAKKEEAAKAVVKTETKIEAIEDKHRNDVAKKQATKISEAPNVVETKDKVIIKGDW